MNTDPKVGGWIARTLLLAAEMNLVRAGILAALDTGGGTRTMINKLILQGTDKFELADKLLYTSQTQVRAFGIGTGRYDPASFTLGGNTRYAIALLNTAQPIKFDLPNLPHGNVLSSVSIFFQGPAATTGAGPATRPTLAVYRQEIATGLEFQIGSTTTVPYGTEAAYETYEEVRCLSLAHTIDRSVNSYYIQVVSEGGANAFAGDLFFPGSTSCTVTKQPVGY